MVLGALNMVKTFIKTNWIDINKESKIELNQSKVVI